MRKNNLTLTAEAVADGAKSGLTELDMKSLGMRSLTPEEMNSIFNIKADGYIIPYDKKGEFCRAKILSKTSLFGTPIKRKYTQKQGTKPRLYLPELGGIKWDEIEKDKKKDLFITEGEKKAAAACKAGYACIGLGGVYCFGNKESGLLTDWDRFELADRNIYIIFDSDIVDKPQVRLAEYTLSIELTARGANVMRIRLPGGPGDLKCGLDDFLVEHGFPKNIKAAQTAFENLPREKIYSVYTDHLTESGNALRFAYKYQDNLRYLHELKTWVYFNPDTGLWVLDKNGEAMRRIKTLPHDLKNQAKKINDEKIQESFLKWAKLSESERNLSASLKLASSESTMVLNQNKLDRDPWFVAFKNGMIMNLQDLRVRKIMPDDYITRSLGVVYDPLAKCPKWEKFIQEIMSDDKEMVCYIQRVIGWSLTGDMSEQFFFILYGRGANGKSTFLSTLLKLFGDYGCTASPQSFMAQKNESQTRSDLVRLQNVRFISTSESESHQRLSESFVKQWTGGEQIATRDLYTKTIEFTPLGKVFLATNHKPRIHGTDHAMWRRVQLIPFTRTFTDEQKDTKLSETLKSELPGILNWVLKGLEEWHKIGLKPPSSVISAVQSYRDDMDLIGAWIKERCEIGSEYKELISDLFEDIKKWSSDNEEYTFNKREFSKNMIERGFDKKQTTTTGPGKIKSKGWFLFGLRLIKNEHRPNKFTKK